MRPVKARKSSTSSGSRPRRPRARYLGLEAATEPFPSTSPSVWVGRLRRALVDAGSPGLPFRLVRSEGRRAIIEVEALDAPAARRAWNRDVGPDDRMRTERTWGTLVGAKAWIGRARKAPRRDGPAAPAGASST
jgi:hypothetical protein